MSVNSKVCIQRRFQLLYNNPPPRLTPTSPYESGEYTKEQLDMRRKAEVLKYKASSSSTKTNNLTKAEKWSQIVKGVYTGNTLYCPITISNIKTPTSSSNVPGPIMNLYYDPSVPLYNYATNTDAYAINNSPISGGWSSYIIENSQCVALTRTNIFNLYIQPDIKNKSYVFDFQLPFAIYINGSNLSQYDYVDNPFDISLNIASAAASVYYSGDPIPTINPICDINGKGVGASIKLASSGSSYADSYSAIIYSGVLTISNLHLYTESGYVYNINLLFDINYDVNSSNHVISNSSVGVYSNLSQEYKRIGSSSNQTNCSIVNGISTQPYSPFSLSGK